MRWDLIVLSDLLYESDLVRHAALLRLLKLMKFKHVFLAERLRRFATFDAFFSEVLLFLDAEPLLLKADGTCPQAPELLGGEDVLYLALHPRNEHSVWSGVVDPQMCLSELFYGQAIQFSHQISVCRSCRGQAMQSFDSVFASDVVPGNQDSNFSLDSSSALSLKQVEGHVCQWTRLPSQRQQPDQPIYLMQPNCLNQLDHSKMLLRPPDEIHQLDELNEGDQLNQDVTPPEQLSSEPYAHVDQVNQWWNSPNQLPSKAHQPMNQSTELECPYRRGEFNKVCHPPGLETTLPLAMSSKRVFGFSKRMGFASLGRTRH